MRPNHRKRYASPQSSERTRPEVANGALEPLAVGMWMSSGPGLEESAARVSAENSGDGAPRD